MRLGHLLDDATGSALSVTATVFTLLGAAIAGSFELGMALMRNCLG